MSFRRFMYYCALCGGAGAYVGWAIGFFLTWMLTDQTETMASGLREASVKGLALGMVVALALSLVDTLWVFSLRQFPSIAARVITAVVVGGLSGLFGGLVSQILYYFTRLELFKVVGYTITGLLIGISLGMFDLIVSVVAGQDSRGAQKKIINGVVGGALGGLLGGVLAVLLQKFWTGLFLDKSEKRLWSPSAWGFVALGLFIGLLISLAQIIMKEAWLRVEAGFRKGRELIINKDEITIGRGESCDIGLFGDSGVEKLHARLIHRGNQYLLEDVGTASGTYVNDARIWGQHPLRSGDVIRLGQCLLRFGERAKRN
jgi:Inner membrane component of T3SS, cytoplasmic domain